jgi:Ni,Fe-hydrogenase III small subunit
MLAQLNRWNRHFLADPKNAKTLVIRGVVLRDWSGKFN